MTHTHTLTRTYTHLPLCHGHTLSIVTDTHQHIDRGVYTYMTSYLAQAYRLSILIDKPTLFIDSWLIRLWVDNVLLINTRSWSILIDKPIPLSIGIPTVPICQMSHKNICVVPCMCVCVYMCICICAHTGVGATAPTWPQAERQNRLLLILLICSVLILMSSYYYVRVYRPHATIHLSSSY